MFQAIQILGGRGIDFFLSWRWLIHGGCEDSTPQDQIHSRRVGTPGIGSPGGHHAEESPLNSNILASLKPGDKLGLCNKNNIYVKNHVASLSTACNYVLDCHSVLRFLKYGTKISVWQRTCCRRPCCGRAGRICSCSTCASGPSPGTSRRPSSPDSIT